MKIENLNLQKQIDSLQSSISSIKGNISSLQYSQGKQEKMNAIGALWMSGDHSYNHTGNNANLEEPIVFDVSTLTNEDVFEVPSAYALGVKTEQRTGMGIVPVLSSVNLMAFSNIRLNSSSQNQDVYIQICKVNGSNRTKIAESWFYHMGYAPYTHFCMAKNVPVNVGDKFFLYLCGSNCDINVLGNRDIWQTALVIEPCEIRA